jgi:hypothetical protein
MKLSLLIGGAVGYVLGAKAGRDRYETIVRIGRRIVGSQTVQATAGVLQAQVESFTNHAKDAVTTRLSPSGAATASVNGRRH